MKSARPAATVAANGQFRWPEVPSGVERDTRATLPALITLRFDNLEQRWRVSIWGARSPLPDPERRLQIRSDESTITVTCGEAADDHPAALEAPLRVTPLPGGAIEPEEKMGGA